MRRNDCTCCSAVTVSDGELLEVVEGSFVRTGFSRRKPVTFIEPLRVDVSLVDVDLDEVDLPCPRRRQQQSHDGRPNPPSPKLRYDVQLVEQGDLTLVPDVRPQGDEG